MFEYKGIKWFKYHGALIPKVAPHGKIDLDGSDIKYLLKKSKAFLIRYTTEWDLKKDGGQFWFVIKDDSPEIVELKSKVRNQVRKGLKNCVVRKVSSNEIIENGFETFFQSQKKYGSLVTKEIFYSTISDNQNIEYFAVYNLENQIIGYSKNEIIDGSCNYIIVNLHPKYLNLYPGYALFFSMNKYYLSNKKVKYVSDGARSVNHDSQIQEYLINKFNFRKAYCKLHIYYRFDIRLLLSFLYPLRGFIFSLQTRRNYKIKALLRQEEIRRSCIY